MFRAQIYCPHCIDFDEQGCFDGTTCTLDEHENQSDAIKERGRRR